jgi:hypothetical protein
MGISHGYVPMSRSGASFAVTVDEGGTTHLNLLWLAEVIRKYDAHGVKLADQSEEVDLALLRWLVQQVDDERRARP